MAISWKVELGMIDLRTLAHTASEPGTDLARTNYPGVPKDPVSPGRRLVAMGLARRLTREEFEERDAWNKENGFKPHDGDGRCLRLTEKGEVVVRLIRLDAHGLMADLFPDSTPKNREATL